MIRELSYYDKIIISTSGGKDSTACVLYLLELGADKNKIELWHQCIDGNGETKKAFFDWPSTEGYVKSFANTFGLQLDYQWRAYGFYGELMRENSKTNDVFFLRNSQLNHLPTKGGSNSTRLKFPSKTASLNTRWCSAYLKIDVAARALNNITELSGKRILFVTGERREESSARSRYNEFELHRTNSKSRLVHHWRIVLDWKERDVWDILEKNSVEPHPAYFLGFPRLSCRSCIFFSKDHWATLHQVDSNVTSMLQSIELQLGFTIDNKYTLQELIKMGQSKLNDSNVRYVKEAVEDYNRNIIVNNWVLPSGAFGSGGGAI